MCQAGCPAQSLEPRNAMWRPGAQRWVMRRSSGSANQDEEARVLPELLRLLDGQCAEDLAVLLCGWCGVVDVLAREDLVLVAVRQHDRAVREAVDLRELAGIELACWCD